MIEYGKKVDNSYLKLTTKQKHKLLKNFGVKKIEDVEDAVLKYFKDCLKKITDVDLRQVFRHNFSRFL